MNLTPEMELIMEGLLAPLAYPLDAGKRVYMGFMLSAALLALLVYCIEARHRNHFNWKAALTYLFPRRIWTHRSARLDYQLLFANSAIKLLLIAPVVFSVLPVALATIELLKAWFGEPPGWKPDPVIISLLFTLILFLIDDFTRFVLHALMHKVPLLWEFHKVHHSAQVLTPFTVYRTHPVENFLYGCRLVIAQGMAIGLCFYWFGPRLTALDIAGANLFTYLFNLTGSNLRHSHVWLSYGPWLEKLFISPAQHQIHHSCSQQHHDRNFGAFLAIWDLLFGSLLLAKDNRSVRLGLDLKNRRYHRQTLTSAYAAPFRMLWQRFIPSPKKRCSGEFAAKVSAPSPQANSTQR